MRQRVIFEFRLERVSLDVLHHQIGTPVELVEVEHRDDMRMLQPSHNLRLAFEPRQEVFVFLKHFVQHLDRHIAIQAGMVGFVDSRHPARPHLADHFILTECLTFERRHEHCPTADGCSHYNESLSFDGSIVWVALITCVCPHQQHRMPDEDADPNPIQASHDQAAHHSHQCQPHQQRADVHTP